MRGTKGRWLAALVLTAAVALTAGCVELLGQRISFRYDAEKDELHLLLFYDGIHEAGGQEDGAEQIPAFVANGDIMIADWFGHIKMDGLREAAADPQKPPEVRELARLAVASVKTSPIGHYRDPHGRIGAAQHVVISNAKEMVRLVNAMINAQALASADEDDEEFPRTRALRVAAARNGHQWLALSRTELSFTAPVHPREWAKIKGERLAEGLEDLVGAEKEDAEVARGVRLVLGAVAQLPLAYREAEGKVTVAFTDLDRPHTIRLNMRGAEEYNGGLEGVVPAAVPDDLDKKLVDALIDGAALPADEAQGLAAVLAWGPPEAAVGALIRALRDPRAERFGQVVKALDAWGEAWNKNEGLPEAPGGGEPMADLLAMWVKFYDALQAFPLKANRWPVEVPAPAADDGEAPVPDQPVLPDQ